MTDVWVERYRPKKLDDVIGHDQPVALLRNSLQTGKLPNLILAGPPGTGKTTTVLCLVRELQGEHLGPNTVLELNASDDRGIDIVRDRIKRFTNEVAKLPPNIPKVVILDEVDAMTDAAQQALRRTMEVAHETTRFALACNQSSKIIDAIQSRCVIVRYGKLKPDEVLKRLMVICDLEKVPYDEDGIKAIVNTADGDLRMAVNNLQSASRAFGCVSEETVQKVCDEPPPMAVRAIFQFTKDGDFKAAHAQVRALIKRGYTPLDICNVMKGMASNDDKLFGPDHVRLECTKKIAKSHKQLQENQTPITELPALLAELVDIQRTR